MRLRGGLIKLLQSFENASNEINIIDVEGRDQLASKIDNENGRCE
jgi:hypothetical protein